MKIQNVTLDNKEIIKAVGLYLTTLGISIPVARVSREYAWKDWDVEFVEQAEPISSLEPVPEVSTPSEPALGEKSEPKPTDF